MSFWQAVLDIFETVSTFTSNSFILSTITTFPIGQNCQIGTSLLLYKGAVHLMHSQIDDDDYDNEIDDDYNDYDHDMMIWW